MASTSDERSGRVQSVDRAVTILEMLARNGWAGVIDVGNELGVHKSTAFRLLSTLERRGLVDQHVDSGKYRLGSGLLYLARAVNVEPGLTSAARPACERLAEQTSETVTLTVLEGYDCVTIDQIVSSSTVVSRSWLGRHTPVHATSPGKVFLAFLPRARRAKLLSRPRRAHTDTTITALDALRAELAKVQDLGYATTGEEFEEGLSAVAAPVRDGSGDIVAAIGISGPSYRLDDARLDECAPFVLEAARNASSGLGYWHRDQSD